MNTDDWDNDEYVWADINGKCYTIDEIDDRYLLNILKFIARGGGYTDFLDDDRIKKLYYEAKKRKIKHGLKLAELQSALAFKIECECDRPDMWGLDN